MLPAEQTEAIIAGNELLLAADGSVRIRSAADIDSLPRRWLLVWCMHTGVYCVPTAELIEWLQVAIGERTAIEIAAGHGAIAQALGVPATDRQIGTVAGDFYAAEGQRLPMLGAHVERLEALDAVDKYRPQVVVCAWGTEKWRPGMTLGCDYGIDERDLLDRVETYIHVGSRANHPHSALPPPALSLRPSWLRSRASVPDDFIAVWRCRR